MVFYFIFGDALGVIFGIGTCLTPAFKGGDHPALLPRRQVPPPPRAGARGRVPHPGMRPQRSSEPFGMHLNLKMAAPKTFERPSTKPASVFTKTCLARSIPMLRRKSGFGCIRKRPPRSGVRRGGAAPRGRLEAPRRPLREAGGAAPPGQAGPLRPPAGPLTCCLTP